MSSRNFSAEKPAARPEAPRQSPRGVAQETLDYRQFFAARWQAFIRENFASPVHAALAFRVDPSTAENWWQGANAPQGWVVGRALADPALRDDALHHLGGAA